MQKESLPHGPIMTGIKGLTLRAEERELLCHPAVGGVILFTRNYDSPEQLRELVGAIRRVPRPLLIGVDHEGGRVQRFRSGFSALPAPATWGRLYDHDRKSACRLAEAHGRLLALELASVDIDFSFMPVLDLGGPNSQVIGDRALHAEPRAVIALARSTVAGLRSVGMAAVGKHFPGHGGVRADSHVELPVDRRSFEALRERDLLPFLALIDARIEALLPAWVLYPAVDDRPACFSSHWLRDILRERLGFTGAILSDDLGMAGAAFAGAPPERARAALDAGCDMVLACNDWSVTEAIVDALPSGAIAPDAAQRLATLQRRPVQPGCDALATRTELAPYLSE